MYGLWLQLPKEEPPSLFGLSMPACVYLTHVGAPHFSSAFPDIFATAKLIEALL
jgi:hypothetical protein